MLVPPGRSWRKQAVDQVQDPARDQQSMNLPILASSQIEAAEADGAGEADTAGGADGDSGA